MRAVRGLSAWSGLLQSDPNPLLVDAPLVTLERVVAAGRQLARQDLALDVVAVPLHRGRDEAVRLVAGKYAVLDAELELAPEVVEVADQFARDALELQVLGN